MKKPHSLTKFRAREVKRIALAIRQAGGGEMTLDPATGGYTVRLTAKTKTAETETGATDTNPWDTVSTNATERPA